MPTSYTSLLGLALPVTGELSGTWGDTVNDSITSLLDSAVAGTTSITTDADITLTTTTGASNQARQAIILWNPASGTTTRNITAPAQSKIYTVINASGGTQSIVFRGVGPTTGVTIVKGESAVVAWNGSDFIKVSNAGGSASFTNVTVSGTTTLSNLTASTALALNSSKEVVSVTNTGTGNNVLSASPTLTGTVAGASLSLSSLTATRVPFAGVAGLLSDSANMTFNGTRLTVADLADSGLTAGRVVYVGSGSALVDSAALTFDGTNLGVGTSSPSSFSGYTTVSVNNATNGGIYNILVNGTETARLQAFSGIFNVAAKGAATNLTFETNGSERMRLDSSGNLGLGVTPSAWTNGRTALQIGGNTVAGLGFAGAISETYTNAYVNSGVYKYFGTGPAGMADFNNASAGGFSWRIASSGTAGSTISWTQALTLDASGNLGVGTTSPSFALDISQAAPRIRQTATTGTNSSLIQLVNTGGTAYIGLDNSVAGIASAYALVMYHGGAYPICFSTSGTERARITSGGEVYIAGTTDQGAYNLQVNGTGVWGAGAYVNGSDERLKEDIATIDAALDVVTSLRPVTFRYKEAYSKDQSIQPGFIAQELQAAMAGKSYLGGIVQEGPQHLNVAYQSLIPLLTKAIQEQQALIESLTARIAALEAA